jgi:hypothetical protein
MTDEELEARLRRHYADRTAREVLPEPSPPTELVAPSPSRRRGLALVAAAAAAAMLVGGLVLLDDDASEVDTIHDPTSTTEPAPTTTEPPTTTTVPTTTTLPEPSEFALVATSDGIAGWWDGARWVQLEDGGAAPAFDGKRFTIVGIGVDRTEALAAPGAPSEFCHPGTAIELDGLDPPEVGSFPPIAVFGVADPLPRPVSLQEPSAEDVTAARDIVASRGIEDLDPTISQVVRADLEGDGTDETLLVVERFDDYYGDQGDYSIVALRKVVDGEMTTSVLHESIVELPGGFEPIGVSRVSAVADLNGDGSLEVALFGRYYEGSATSVMSIDAAGHPTPILHAECGL